MAWFGKAPPAPSPAAPLFLPITSLTAALLALLSVRLAVIIIRVRRGSKIPYQSDDRVFVKRQRAHANLSECVAWEGGGRAWGAERGALSPGTPRPLTSPLLSHALSLRLHVTPPPPLLTGTPPSSSSSWP